MQVTIVADSINVHGNRLTTFVLIYPRFIHAELLTHRAFSRNASSSRAIPIEKMIEHVTAQPAIPVEWGKNTAGMQAKEVISPEEAKEATSIWLAARDSMIDHVQKLLKLKVHKQIANRLLEPFQMMKTILSGTDFENFFALRAHSDAQPELQQLAKLMLKSYNASTPILTRPGEWHIPFANDIKVDTWSEKMMIAIARCARVSYLNFQGKNDYSADKKLYQRLIGSVPRHLSPTEHVAEALESNARIGNFQGWKQYRYRFEDQSLSDDRVIKKSIL